MICGFLSRALNQFLFYTFSPQSLYGVNTAAKSRGSWELNCRCDLSKLPSNIQRGVVATVWMNIFIMTEYPQKNIFFTPCTSSKTRIKKDTDLSSKQKTKQKV